MKQNRFVSVLSGLLGGLAVGVSLTLVYFVVLLGLSAFLYIFIQDLGRYVPFFKNASDFFEGVFLIIILILSLLAGSVSGFFAGRGIAINYDGAISSHLAINKMAENQNDQQRVPHQRL